MNVWAFHNAKQNRGDGKTSLKWKIQVTFTFFLSFITFSMKHRYFIHALCLLISHISSARLSQFISKQPHLCVWTFTEFFMFFSFSRWAQQAVGCWVVWIFLLTFRPFITCVRWWIIKNLSADPNGAFWEIMKEKKIFFQVQILPLKHKHPLHQIFIEYVGLQFPNIFVSLSYILNLLTFFIFHTNTRSGCKLD